jgi:hypothetical protein
MEPPADSSIPYLDWGLQNTIEGDEEEWVCARNSVHVHNGSGLLVRGETPKPRTRIPGSKIHAFLRLDPADHKQVMFAALLNLVIVWLAEAGRLSSEVGGTATPWIAVTPALLLAYGAQQRRHYFAQATRWVRIVLWAYLLLNIAFLVSITFDIAPDGSFADRHGFTNDAMSILMASASISVFWLFGFLGRPYEWLMEKAFRLVRWRNRWKWFKPKHPETTVHSYVRVARWYGNLAVAMILVSLAAMAGIVITGNGPNPPSPSKGDSARAGAQGTPQSK